MAKEGSKGIKTMIGQKVLLLCGNYFYTGSLVEVNPESVTLEDASIVYETGEWTANAYANAERLPGKQWHVRLGFIESYGISK